MDDFISDKLQSILSNPESLKAAMEFITKTGILSSPSEKKEEKNEEVYENTDKEVPTEEDISDERKSVMPVSSPIQNAPHRKDDDRINLLRSLKPFLDTRRQGKIDSLVMALNAAKLFSSYKNDDIAKQLGNIFGSK